MAHRSVIPNDMSAAPRFVSVDALRGLTVAAMLLVNLWIPLQQVTQPLVPGGIPIQLIDLRNQRGKRGGLFDEGTGIGKDLLHQLGPMRAEVDQRDLVKLQPGRSGP